MKVTIDGVRYVPAPPASLDGPVEEPHLAIHDGDCCVRVQGVEGDGGEDEAFVSIQARGACTFYPFESCVFHTPERLEQLALVLTRAATWLRREIERCSDVSTSGPTQGDTP